MAIGTMTLAGKDIEGTQKALFVDSITLVGDTSYPTGGMTGVQTALRALTKDQREIIAVFNDGLNGGYMPVWDRTAGKLLMLNSGAGDANSLPTEIANATSLDEVTFKFTVLSK